MQKANEIAVDVTAGFLSDAEKASPALQLSSCESPDRGHAEKQSPSH